MNINEKFNQALYSLANTRAKLQSQPYRVTAIELWHYLMGFMFRTAFKADVMEYVSYVVIFSSSSEIVNGTVKKTGTGAAFIKTAMTLKEKLNETFPKKTQKPIKKYLYRAIEQRAVSITPTVQYGLEPFLSKNENMVLNAPKDPIVGLRVILEQGDSRQRIIKQVKNTLRLPAFYMLLVVVFAHVMQDKMISMMVGFAKKLDTEPTPAIIRMDAVNNFIIDGLAEISVFLLITIAVYSWMNSNSTGIVRAIAERVPLFGSPIKQSRLVQSGLLLQSIALLYTSGVNTKRALNLIANNSTRFVSFKVNEMLDVHRATGSDIEAYRNDIFDLDVQFKLSVYFELTDPSTNMTAIAEAILTEIEEKIQMFARRVNIFSTVIFAIYLMLFVQVHMTSGEMLPSR